MDNLINFLNSFLSYLLVFGVFLIVIGVAITLGIILRKRKNQIEAVEQETES